MELRLLLDHMMHDQGLPVARLQTGQGRSVISWVRDIEQYSVCGTIDANAGCSPANQEHSNNAPLEIVERLIHLSPRSLELSIEDTGTEERPFERSHAGM